MVFAMTAGALLFAGSPALAACHQFRFDKDVYPAREDVGSVRITVSRDANLASSSIKYQTVDGTAKAGSDYKALSGTLSYSNQISMSFSVPIINDTKNEPTESFKVRLYGPSGCLPNPNYDVDQPSTVVIADNDPKPAPKATPTQTPTPTPTSKAFKPKPTPTLTPTPTSSSTPTQNESAIPIPTSSAVAASDEGSGGFSRGAIALIAIAVLAASGTGAVFVRRRFFT